MTFECSECGERCEDATEIYEATTYKNTSYTDIDPDPVMTRRCPKHPEAEVCIWRYSYNELLGSHPTMLLINLMHDQATRVNADGTLKTFDVKLQLSDKEIDAMQSCPKCWRFGSDIFDCKVEYCKIGLIEQHRCYSSDAIKNNIVRLHLKCRFCHAAKIVEKDTGCYITPIEWHLSKASRERRKEIKKEENVEQ
jgi:hypothetical protein